MTNNEAVLCPKPARVQRRGRHLHSRGCGPTRTYLTWTNMLTRCRNPNRCHAPNYMQRGITVCDRWLLFDNFLADMGERPEGKTLDRIDNDAGYTPENCRWATLVEQARNSRRCKLKYEQALQIALRMLAGEKASVVAKDFNVSESLPREIHRGRTWRDAHAAARNQQA